MQFAKARADVALNPTIGKPVPVAGREVRTCESLFHDQKAAPIGEFTRSRTPPLVYKVSSILLEARPCPPSVPPPSPDRSTRPPPPSSTERSVSSSAMSRTLSIVGSTIVPRPLGQRSPSTRCSPLHRCWPFLDAPRKVEPLQDALRKVEPLQDALCGGAPVRDVLPRGWRALDRSPQDQAAAPSWLRDGGPVLFAVRSP